MMCAMRWGVFLFFAGWVVIMTFFVYFCLPGKSLSDKDLALLAPAAQVLHALCLAWRMICMLWQGLCFPVQVA